MYRSVCGILLIAATATTSTAQPPDLTGRWSGHWVSEKNGHNGPLHARFRRVDADTYRVAFRGRFAKIVPFWYTTKLDVTGLDDDAITLSASQRLPLLGTYSTTATATATNFEAIFSSRGDTGKFILSRRSAIGK